MNKVDGKASAAARRRSDAHLLEEDGEPADGAAQGEAKPGARAHHPRPCRDPLTHSPTDGPACTHTQISHRSHTDHTEITQRSHTDHTQITHRSHRDHTQITHRSHALAHMTPPAQTPDQSRSASSPPP
eukprot:1266328-Rhodomonas_salina.1